MKLVKAIITAVMIFAGGILGLFSLNKNHENKIDYYASQLISEEAMINRNTVEKVLGFPIKEEDRKLFYDNYNLSFDETGALIEITILSPDITILRNSVTVGSSVSSFDAAYKNRGAENGRVEIFNGKYSLTNFEGIKIECFYDKEDIIEKIIISQLILKG